MSQARASLFIGSSTEGLPIAHALQELLHHDMDPTVWSQGLFQPTASLLQRLVREAGQYDIAVFIFVPDDDLLLRQQQYRAVRDNVLFEYGLFVGAIGLERCFLVMPFDVADVRLPTDLLGTIPLTFNSSRADRNLVAALGPAAGQLRRAWDAMAPAPTSGRPLSPPETPAGRLERFLRDWNTEPLLSDRALLKAGIGDPTDDEFPRASILRVFAFLEAVADAVLAGRIPDPMAKDVLGAVTRSFWPHAAVLLAFPGEPEEFWNPPPQLAELYKLWSGERP